MREPKKVINTSDKEYMWECKCHGHSKWWVKIIKGEKNG